MSSDFEHVVVHSEDARQTLLTNGYDDERIHTYYLAADTQRLTASTDTDLEQSLPQLDYLLMVGRVVPQKDVLALLRIFAEVNRRRPNTALIIAGNRGQADKYQRQLDSAIADLGLQNRVLFAGQVINPAVLASLYRHARLLLVTSEWESFCVPIAEAMTFGTPAAVHNQPPMTEVAGPAGILFDKHQPEQAAQDIVALLEDKTRYDRLAENATVRSALFTDAALRQSILRFLMTIFAVGDGGPDA
ncbi:MAG: glycosyltransferase [Chloroflexota bacterium]